MEMAEADDLSKFKFDPTGDVLVDYYLHAKIAGNFHDVDGSYRRFFSDADVCSTTPDNLVADHVPAPCTSAVDGQVWYFFSTLRYVGASEKKPSRTVDGTGGKERWHSEGRPKAVDGSAADGQVQRFSYRVTTAPGVFEKPGWVMMEYSFKGAGRGDTVLCKVSRSRLAKKATKASSAAAATSGRKRKAVDDGEHLEAAAASTNARARQQQTDDAQYETGAAGGISEHLIQTLETILMTDDDDEAFAVQVPDGEDPCEFHERLLFGDDDQQLQRHGEPEPQFAPALQEMETFLMTDDDDDAVAVHVPDGEEPLAFYARRLFGADEQQLGAVLQQHGDAAVQTMHGPLSESDVISYLAAGFTVGELLDGPSTSGAAHGVTCAVR